MRNELKFFLFIGVIALAIMLFISFYLILFTNKNPSTEEPNQKNNQNIENNIEGSNKETTQNTETLEGEPSSPSMKEEESIRSKACQFSYALKNRNIISKCIEADGDICIKKTINCSVTVKNLEDTFSGLFKMKLSFLENNALFQESYKEKELGPEESETMSTILEIKSSGEEGRANKELSCEITPIEIPKKEICN